MKGEKDEKTWDFDPAGREEYAEVMQDAGYVEKEGFEASDHVYCCFNCPYMEADSKSPTGYFCTKWGFPDKPWGCSDGWSQLNASMDKTD